MAGKTALSELLSSMTPVLAQDEYVFLTIDPKERDRLQSVPVCEFHETEGLTVILRKQEAELSGLEYEFPCRMITLNVHSSLSAVGFLAAVTARLAECGISVNAVSAFYHDHLFVPAEKAAEAVMILKNLSAESA